SGAPRARPAVCRTVTGPGPRSADSRDAPSRMTARVLRPPWIERTDNVPITGSIPRPGRTSARVRLYG
ncbi:hypothetical protein, partial [Streptomyces sp. PU_AKi4]|uniref:hypothetical protein n=1 Tax=Streptomyces sp. PU_AKi4 TaxID=2800809 RepID=UPI003523E31B